MLLYPQNKHLSQMENAYYVRKFAARAPTQCRIRKYLWNVDTPSTVSNKMSPFVATTNSPQA